MINEKSLTACLESRFGTFQKPLYDTYCFSRIPSSIQQLLGRKSFETLPRDVFSADTYDNVILILLDSFGWKAFERSLEHSAFLQRFSKNGIVSKLTSQFPSTTTAHVTCLHTGLSVGKSGLYEWFEYEPIVDTVITPLRFSYAQDRKPNTLLGNVEPAKLFPFSSIYEELQKEGIESFVFQPKDISSTPYSSVLQKGATSIGYKRLREGLNKLRKAYQETAAKKNYFFFYYPEIDAHGHEFGPDSPHTDKEITSCLQQLEHFAENFGPARSKTCLIVTADHGMTAVDPKKTIYLNQQLPGIQDVILRNSQGKLIVPCGSSRDFFLHIHPEAVQVVKQELKKLLAEHAEVYTTQELMEQGLFGVISERFLERVGNLVILPYAPYSVWWYKEGIFENSYYGHHGGLSAEELEIPFLVQELH